MKIKVIIKPIVYKNNIDSFKGHPKGSPRWEQVYT